MIWWLTIFFNFNSYEDLAEMGFDHFNVIHKDNFSAEYTDGENTKDINTNRIEGAWKITKERLRIMNGNYHDLIRN